MHGKSSPIRLPFTQGSVEHGFNANIMYDAVGDSVAQLYGLPQSTTLCELQRSVEAGDFNGAWTVGAARAAFIVKACNLHDELVAALKDAVDSLEYVNKVAPILTGCAVRAVRINAAHGILSKLEAE